MNIREDGQAGLSADVSTVENLLNKFRCNMYKCYANGGTYYLLFPTSSHNNMTVEQTTEVGATMVPHNVGS